MLLGRLPCSILGQIFNNQDSSWCVLELWKCGSSELNARLAKSITDIHLTDLDPLSTSRWPRCLKEFPLERLSVNRGDHGPLGTTLALQKQLKKLSPTLKSLSIIGRGASRAFFFVPNERTESDDEPADAPPSKRSKLEEASHDEPYLEKWNLNMTWPQLERLNIGLQERDYSAPEDLSIFHSSVFGFLPRSLTYFNFPYKFIDQAHRDLSALPSGLKTLRLQHWVIDPEGLKTLPKTLTNVGRILGEHALDMIFFHSKILPNLTDFPSDLDITTMDGNLASYTYDGTPWPESFRYMPLWHVNSKQMFTKLPSKLVTLLSVGGDETTTLRPRYIAGLPRTLETIQLMKVQWEGIDVESWPSNLTYMKVTFIAGFGLPCFSLLPRSLTVLEMEPEDPRDSESNVKRVNNSKSLEELKAIGRNALHIDQERWATAKAMLMSPQNIELGSEAYTKRVEDGELFGLPLGLTKLIWPEYPTPPLQTRLLPPYIESHTISARIDDSDALDLIPPTNSINLTANIQRAKNPDFSDASPSESALYRSSLHSLHVTFKTPGLKHSCLKYLPRDLKNLELHGLNYIRTSELQCLPSKLEKLDIDCSFATPLAPWVHLLPSTLISLSISAPIRGYDIINLPPNLEFISAPFFSVTLAQARQLPRQLRSIDVKRSDERVVAEKHGVLHGVTWHALEMVCKPFWRIREYSESFLQSELALVSNSSTVGLTTHLTEELQTLEYQLSSLFLDVPLDNPQYPEFEEDPNDSDSDDNEGSDEDSADYDSDDGSEPDKCDGRGDAAEMQEQDEEDLDFRPVRTNHPVKTSMTLITEPTEDLDPRVARRFVTISQ